MTPLGQYAVTLYVSSLFAQKDEFKRLVEDVFKTNYKDPEEAFQHLKEFWIGNRSMTALFALFLSRTDYERSEYAQEGERVEEDPLQKSFMEEEDKCKYDLVYPYFGNLGATLDQFSMARPAVLRRVITGARQTERENQRGGRAATGRGIRIFQESFDLLMPTGVRAKYLRRIRPILNALRSDPRDLKLLPAQVFVAQREFEELGREVDRLLDLPTNESYLKELESDLKPLREAQEENFGFMYELAQAVRAETVPALANLGRAAVQRITRLSREALDILASEHKGNPKAFTWTIHNLVDHAFHSALALGGSFLYFGYVYSDSLRPEEHEKAVPVFLAYLERVILRIEAFLAGAYLGALHKHIPKIARGADPIPLAELGMSVSKLQARVLLNGLESASKYLYDRYAEPEGGRVLRNFEDVLYFDNPYIFPIHLPPSQVYTEGVAGLLSQVIAHDEARGPNGGYRTYLTRIHIVRFEPEFAKAVVNMATREPGSDVGDLANVLVTDFNRGFASSGILLK